MSVAIGLDLSLTSTGAVAVVDGQYVDFINPKSKGKKGDTYQDFLKRTKNINNELLLWVELLQKTEGNIDLAVIEGPSHGSSFGNPHERAGLWWRVVDMLDNHFIPVAQVAPASRAKYITGDGRAKKPVVLAHAIERYVGDNTPRVPNDDVADALGMADMGARHLGEPIVPDDLMPDANLLSMGAVKWPT